MGANSFPFDKTLSEEACAEDSKAATFLKVVMGYICQM